MPRWNNKNCGFQKGHKSFLNESSKGKMSEAHKGKIPSSEAKRKMSEAAKKRGFNGCGFKKGNIWHAIMRGDKNPNWKGGISGTDRHREMSRVKYKQWRMVIFIRDNFSCQFCGKRGCYLEAHHIKSWSKYPELRYSVENGVTLCSECHRLTQQTKI